MAGEFPEGCVVTTFTEDLTVNANIVTTGTVGGVDVIELKTSHDALASHAPWT